MTEFLEEYLFPFFLLIILTSSLIWYFMHEHNKNMNHIACMKKCKPEKADVIEGKCHCQVPTGWEIKN